MVVACPQCAPNAGAGLPLTVVVMTRQLSAGAPPIPPAADMLDLEDLQVRYRIGKTKANELVALPGFPNSVVPGMHRYPAAAIDAYDFAAALAGTVADPAKDTPTPPVVITRPAPGKPGPKPKRPSTSEDDRS